MEQNPDAWLLACLGVEVDTNVVETRVGYEALEIGKVWSINAPIRHPMSHAQPACGPFDRLPAGGLRIKQDSIEPHKHTPPCPSSTSG